MIWFLLALWPAIGLYVSITMTAALNDYWEERGLPRDVAFTLVLASYGFFIGPCVIPAVMYLDMPLAGFESYWYARMRCRRYQP